MTPQENRSDDERTLQTLEEICENTRAIRRVVNRIFDHLHEYQDQAVDDDPDALKWEDFYANDDVYS